MKKFVVIAAALSAAGGVQAAPASSANSSSQKRVTSAKPRVANTTLRTRAPMARKTSGRTQVVASNTTVAAISEKAASGATTQEQDVSSNSQSSATRLALPSATSTVQATKPGPRMIPVDNFKFAANVYYYGSSIASPFDSRVPDFYQGYQDRQSDTVNAEVHFMAGYRFHPNYTFSLNPQYSIAPASSSGPGNNTQNTFMKPIASYFRLAVGTILQYKNMKWNGDLRIHPGITDDLRHTPLYLRTGQNLTFTLTKNLNFAVYNSLRYYFRNSSLLEANQSRFDSGEAPFAPYEFRWTSSPALEYQAGEKVGVAVSYNIDNRLAYGTNMFTPSNYYHEKDGPYIEAGTSLDFIPSLNLNPYVDVYTRRPNFYGTRWGINVGWTIL